VELILLQGTLLQLTPDAEQTVGCFAGIDMREFNSPKNKELGAATVAYVNQTFTEEQIHSGISYECIDDNNGLTLIWNNDHPEPTDEQLEVALHRSNWDEVRKQRDALLTATDFYALSDVTMSADMATYREDLRDLPASTAKSEDVVWPTKP
jgi:hypothetical protein